MVINRNQRWQFYSSQLFRKSPLPFSIPQTTWGTLFPAEAVVFPKRSLGLTPRWQYQPKSSEELSGDSLTVPTFNRFMFHSVNSPQVLSIQAIVSLSPHHHVLTQQIKGTISLIQSSVHLVQSEHWNGTKGTGTLLQTGHVSDSTQWKWIPILLQMKYGGLLQGIIVSLYHFDQITCRMWAAELVCWSIKRDNIKKKSKFRSMISFFKLTFPKWSLWWDLNICETLKDLSENSAIFNIIKCRFSHPHKT